MALLRCISPVDGREIVRRETTSPNLVLASIENARKAQREWAAAGIAERVDVLLRFLDCLRALNDEIVPELAWQMGRPVRYGGEGRGRVGRVSHMAAGLRTNAAPPATAGGGRA